MSKQDQQAVREAATEAAKLNRTLSLAADSDLKGKLAAAGVTINAVDQAPFIAATKPVYDKWRKTFPDLVDAMVKEAAKP